VSLLTFKKQLDESLDSMKLSSADSAAMQKMINRKNAEFNIPIVWNDRVYKALCFLNRGGKGPIDKWIARANYYLPTIKKMFIDSGVPEDIAYLPLIESGFNPLAYSRAKAAGMWQFIPSTGKLYGLHKDFWVDERRDFVASTKAAISYFKKLYNQFNDWHIALASYNCGENSMCRALARSSVKNYWSLNRLPKETKHYVPEFLAALIAAKNPTYAGGANTPTDTFNLDTVTVNECISLYALADTLQMSYGELREINPHILHWCSHPRLTTVIYLPKGKKERFLSAYTPFASAFGVEWYSYLVKPGESLRSIARHFKVPVEALVALNELAPSRRLAVGMGLSVPIPVNQSPGRETAIKERENHFMPSFKTAMVNGAKVIKYKVRSGDCIGGLSQLFRVDKKDLCGWNNIQDAASLRAGMILTIYKTPESLKTLTTSSNPADPSTPQAIPIAAATASQVTSPAPSTSPMASVSPSSVTAPAPAASASAVLSVEQSTTDTQHVERSPDGQAKRIVYYKVQKGDNLWHIAQSFKVPVQELTAMNDIHLDTTLLPGLVLKVPLTEQL
jgi:membrane-bound lytic murein transglycosylase D